jgi:hypothetical protein
LDSPERGGVGRQVDDAVLTVFDHAVGIQLFVLGKVQTDSPILLEAAQSGLVANAGTCKYRTL